MKSFEDRAIKSSIDMEESEETRKMNEKDNQIDDMPELDLENAIIGENEQKGIFIGLNEAAGKPILLKYPTDEDKTDLYGITVDMKQVPAFIDCVKEAGVSAKEVKRMVLMFNTEEDYEKVSKVWEEYNRKEGK